MRVIVVLVFGLEWHPALDGCVGAQGTTAMTRNTSAGHAPGNTTAARLRFSSPETAVFIVTDGANGQVIDSRRPS
jgi:hypothetical protein